MAYDKSGKIRPETGRYKKSGNEGSKGGRYAVGKKYGPAGNERYETGGESGYGTGAGRKQAPGAGGKYGAWDGRNAGGRLADGGQAGGEQQDEMDKLEGRNSVMEALKAGRTINKLLVSKGEREGSITQIIALAKQKGIVVQEVERQKLDSLSSTRSHQGVIAFVAVKDYAEVDDILEAAQEKGEKPFIIILDEISDAYNLGSILRTAECVGAHGVIIPKRRAVGLTPAVSKASAGAIEYIPVARVTNLAQTIDYLKKQNIWIVGTDSSGRDAFYEIDFKVPLALVIGSEGEGMGRLVREKCDYVVNIPMKGRISSLNAAVAGAIVMYDVLKQRGI